MKIAGRFEALSHRRDFHPSVVTFSGWSLSQLRNSLRYPLKGPRSYQCRRASLLFLIYETCAARGQSLVLLLFRLGLGNQPVPWVKLVRLCAIVSLA